MNNKKVYVCKRLKLYDWLVNHGFEPFCKRRDRENYNYYVWLFDDTDELQSSITEYYNNKR